MHCLTIELADVEGALLRLLGTTERRGWRPVGVVAGGGPRGLTVELQVRGKGSLELFTRQLSRLQEVLEVRASATRQEVVA